MAARAPEHHDRAAFEAPTSFDELARALRTARGFDAAEVFDAKVGRVTRWFAEQSLDAAVVGVSGGVDSAVVLGLLDAVRRRSGSPLRRLVAAIVPIDGPGATGQHEAEARARLVADHFDVEAWVCPLGDAHASTMASLAAASGIVVDGWAAGQLLAVERTPVLYGAVALLRSIGHRGVVVGTTNRDEGAYLGFFGKASDGAVDLQPVSDLHKSEVRAIATLLGVPDVVVAAAPSGDVWDGRDDEEMIGASYDEVEVVLRLLELRRDPRRIAAALHDGERLASALDAVERCHRVNAHKYRVGSPAVHLDVLPRGVPGGWDDERLADRFEHDAPEGLPGRWDPPPIALDPPACLPAVERHPLCTIGRDVLSRADCAALRRALTQAPASAVGVTGVSDELGRGSWRSTAFSPGLADELWGRIAPLVASIRFHGPHDPTDAHATADRRGHRTWRVVGLSPVLRFMRYEPGGHHLGHYDAAYDYGDGRRTLASVVCFLTGDGGDAGGALRFLDDGQADRPTAQRDHSDWSRPATDDEVLAAVAPAAGTVVVFDHRRSHDVEPWAGPGERIVIRADVVYERVPDGRGCG